MLMRSVKPERNRIKAILAEAVSENTPTWQRTPPWKDGLDGMQEIGRVPSSVIFRCQRNSLLVAILRHTVVVLFSVLLARPIACLVPCSVRNQCNKPAHVSILLQETYGK